ncbi:hypothetical protein GCM10023350_54320 [Nocardioides endophyticus]|uniref:Uncharacterized protein n=1 Tax=Nocardioides endophyticus TaxID=1353775 RepID=A0ABP8ZP70_9ACTN
MQNPPCRGVVGVNTDKGDGSKDERCDRTGDLQRQKDVHGGVRIQGRVVHHQGVGDDGLTVLTRIPRRTVTRWTESAPWRIEPIDLPPGGLEYFLTTLSYERSQHLHNAVHHCLSVAWAGLSPSPEGIHARSPRRTPMTSSSLSQPLTFGRVELPHRLALAPMTGLSAPLEAVYPQLVRGDQQ